MKTAVLILVWLISALAPLSSMAYAGVRTCRSAAAPETALQLQADAITLKETVANVQKVLSTAYRVSGEPRFATVSRMLSLAKKQMALPDDCFCAAGAYAHAELVTDPQGQKMRTIVICQFSFRRDQEGKNLDVAVLLHESVHLTDENQAKSRGRHVMSSEFTSPVDPDLECDAEAVTRDAMNLSGRKIVRGYPSLQCADTIVKRSK